MGVDTTVNLKQMDRMADSICNRGMELGYTFENMIADVKKMQKYWVGESYAKFANTVNKTIPTLEAMEKYFSRQLPNEILKKEKQYAKAMQKNTITEEIVGVPFTLEKVPVKDQGDEIKYNSASMTSLASKIDQRFDRILQAHLPKIKEDFNSITWKGSTGDALRKEFKTYIENTREAVKKIRTAFRKCLEAQGQAIEKAEEGNKISGARADVSGLNTGAVAAEQQAEKANSETYNWESNT